MGLATAKAFAEAGAAVTLADVNEAAVRSAADDLVAAGHKAIGIRCDVADEAEVAAMVEQTVSTFGRLDAAYNNAGIQSPAVETADVSGDVFDRINAITDRASLMVELGHLHSLGYAPLFRINGENDYHNSKMIIASLGTGAGPSMPISISDRGSALPSARDPNRKTR